jgi:hypothetical protein
MRRRERRAPDSDLPQSIWVSFSPRAAGVTAASGLNSVSESGAAAPALPALRRVDVESPGGVEDERRMPAMREMDGRETLDANGASA